MLLVVPGPACEMLAPDKGAYVSVLTWAASETEYRSKVVPVMNEYCLDVVEITGVEPFTQREARGTVPDDLFEIAERISSPKHVIYGTFYTFPRVM